MEERTCLRCGNADPEYFWNDEGVWYCRRCIAFGRIDAGQRPIPPKWEKRVIHCEYHLKYPLTAAQKRTVDEVMEGLNGGHDVLIYAATGAGKTELTMEAIRQYFARGKRVGFAIARRQVVLEIAERMHQAFPDLEVRAVCEGHTDQVYADLVVCTMHQLYRYPDCFDLLIMDEVDAFPYRGNDMLKAIAMQACSGQLLYLTATPDEEMLADVEAGRLKMVTLFERPHRHPLIVPKLVCAPSFVLYALLIRFLHQNHLQHKQTLVFVPTIAMSKRLAMLFRPLFSCAALSSQSEDRDEVLAGYRRQQKEVLFATTVLERGITIPDVQVAVLHGEHPVFTAASLIQMIGRAGRNIDFPDGRGLFLCTQKSEDLKQCIRELERMNATLCPDAGSA